MISSIFLLGGFLGCVERVPEWVKFTNVEIVHYWAPLWYQDTAADSFRADFITNFDYDGNWVGKDNWENLHNYELLAYIYYSFIETEDHWFLGYYDFHPRDWSQGGWFFEHENDMEGVVLIVQKSSEGCGTLLVMIIQAHNEYWSYTAASWITGAKGETIDGQIEMERLDTYDVKVSFQGHNHPIVYVEAKGHGVYGSPSKIDFDNNFEGDDGIIYRPGGVAEEPPSGDESSISYGFKDIKEIWDQRNNIGEGKTFARYGVFDGDNGADNDAAKAPWGWDDDDDNSIIVGELFTNPGRFANLYFNGEDFSEEYLVHPYQENSPLTGEPLQERFRDWIVTDRDELH